MAHGRSRSGNVLVPLASGGRHECFRAQLLRSRTPENGRYGPTACTLVGREDEAEDIDTLLFGVQRTGAGAQAVSEVSDFGHIGVHVLEVIGLAARSAQSHGQRASRRCGSEPRSPTTENLSVPGGGSYAQLVTRWPTTPLSKRTST